jgi:predicted Zn finger-like uncharacterized protein
MNVTCPNCATIYRVDPAKVPEAGVRARCNVCSAVFAVRREVEQGRPAPAAPAPTRVVESSRPAAQEAPPRPPPVTAPEPSRAAVPESPAPAAPSTPPAAAPRPAAPQRPAAPAGGPSAHGVRPGAAPAASSPAVPANPPAPAAPAMAPRPPAPASAPPTTVPPAAPKPAAPVAAPAAAGSPRPGAPPTGRPANPFLSQDPALKARRLARALISDMVVYHPGKRQEGLRDGNLKELFEEEIKKSWEEYAEQVGRDVAESTAYFKEALNEILAGGRQLF